MADLFEHDQEWSPTRPQRVPSKQWRVGDIVTIGTVRWKSRSIIRGHGVELEAMNIALMWWTTTLGRLPKKVA